VRCDLHEAGDVAHLAEEVRANAGSVSALVHAAVQTPVAPLLELGHQQVSAVVRSSGLSLLALVAAFDDLLAAGSSVVYVTSIGSERVIAGYGAVGTAKAVGESLVRYLAVELAPRGVRVNAISAGPFASKAAADVVGDTDALMRATDAATPRGRRLDLDEIADVAAYLVDPRSSGVTGQVVTVDAGIFHRWSL
jgi:enoyl-[acyl-carrier protein] reductase III